MNTKLTTALGLTLVSALTMGAILSTPNTEAFMRQRREGMHERMMKGHPLENINREINELPKGVEVILTSDDPEIIKELQSKETKGPQNDEITRIQENISNGVKITISSENSDLVKMIQKHAENHHHINTPRKGKENKRGKKQKHRNENGMRNMKSHRSPYYPERTS